MTAAGDDAAWTFERMRPGEVLGRARTVVDDALVDRWLALYRGRPDPRPLVPAGMAMPVVMRGYAEAVTPRPPGNVHAAQSLEVLRAPRVGEPLVTTVRCDSKELRRGRRWVRLGVETVDASGHTCYRGVITTLWAR